jgi:hypothetical protein
LGFFTVFPAADLLKPLHAAIIHTILLVYCNQTLAQCAIRYVKGGRSPGKIPGRLDAFARFSAVF